MADFATLRKRVKFKKEMASLALLSTSLISCSEDGVATPTSDNDKINNNSIIASSLPLMTDAYMSNFIATATTAELRGFADDIETDCIQAFRDRLNLTAGQDYAISNWSTEFQQWHADILNYLADYLDNNSYSTRTGFYEGIDPITMVPIGMAAIFEDDLKYITGDMYSSTMSCTITGSSSTFFIEGDENGGVRAGVRGECDWC